MTAQSTDSGDGLSIMDEMSRLIHEQPDAAVVAVQRIYVAHMQAIETLGLQTEELMRLAERQSPPLVLEKRDGPGGYVYLAAPESTQ
jgi:hypothetical protein